LVPCLRQTAPIGFGSRKADSAARASLLENWLVGIIGGAVNQGWRALFGTIRPSLTSWESDLPAAFKRNTKRFPLQSSTPSPPASCFAHTIA
jgi:hypothetical protein